MTGERHGRRGGLSNFGVPTELSFETGNVNNSRSLSGKRQTEHTWNPQEADPFAKKKQGNYNGNVIDRR